MPDKTKRLELRTEDSVYGYVYALEALDARGSIEVRVDVCGEEQTQQQLLVYPADEMQEDDFAALRFDAAGHLVEVLVPSGVVVTHIADTEPSKWLQTRDGH